MINLDCMELGDCFTPEQLVEKIFRQCPDIKAPIPIREIARAVGIVDIKTMSTENVEGMLVADDAKSAGVIFFKESSPLGRQRFTIGHELGHFLLLHHGSEQSCAPDDIKFCSSSNALKSLEFEANQFSELLLMPEDLVSRAINGSILNMELLKSISGDFEISFEAMANKCSSLSNTPFALIYSKDGVVRYCWRDRKRFPWWVPFKKNDLLPPSSQAISLSQPEETISSPVEVDPTEWISINDKQSTPDKLFEQTYTQLDGYQVTMIRF
ncbi:MAG: ImmA/IrrE family metallo-endopeptidase [Bacillota bacterium]